MTIQQLRRHLRQELSPHFGERAAWEADRLIAAVLGIPPPQLELKKEQVPAPDEQRKIRDFAASRRTGKPLEYILGFADFMGCRMKVDSRVLIPRLDSEAMVMAGVQHLRENKMDAPRMIDFGAGSGALGLASLSHFEEGRLWSVEKDPGALEVLGENVRDLKMESKVTIVRLDLDQPGLSGLPPEADLILANPPYIDFLDDDLDPDVKNFEPGVALFAADRGLEKIFRWSQKGLSLLSSKGLFLCEIGWRQSSLVTDWYESELADRAEMKLGRDLAGGFRFFSLRRKE